MLCVIYRLGLIEHRKALSSAKRALHKRSESQIQDVLLLLEHPSMITISKSVGWV